MIPLPPDAQAIFIRAVVTMPLPPTILMSFQGHHLRPSARLERVKKDEAVYNNHGYNWCKYDNPNHLHLDGRARKGGYSLSHRCKTLIKIMMFIYIYSDFSDI